MSVREDWDQPPKVRPPDFDNLLSVLSRQRPSRPTLFEFSLNAPLEQRLLGDDRDKAGRVASMYAWRNAGYDYMPITLPNFMFAAGDRDKAHTVSLNEGGVISDRNSFDAYVWPDPELADDTLLDDLAKEIPKGMKLIVRGPGGVFEDAIKVVGYDRLCLMLFDDTQLVFDVFEEVGSRLVR